MPSRALWTEFEKVGSFRRSDIGEWVVESRTLMSVKGFDHGRHHDGPAGAGGRGEGYGPVVAVEMSHTSKCRTEGAPKIPGSLAGANVHLLLADVYLAVADRDLRRVPAEVSQRP